MDEIKNLFARLSERCNKLEKQNDDLERSNKALVEKLDNQIIKRKRKYNASNETKVCINTND